MHFCNLQFSSLLHSQYDSLEATYTIVRYYSTDQDLEGNVDFEKITLGKIFQSRDNNDN